jgi:ATP-dependent Lhr-like helicase
MDQRSGRWAQGVVLRGQFRVAGLKPGPTAAKRGSASTEPTIEWCDRRLLSRIHRYTLNRLRAEVEPVSPADFVRFLFQWQHVAPASKLTGIDGLLHVIRTLDGFELAAGAWESAVLPSRLDRYDASMLDMLCLTGQVGWARLTEATTQARLVRTTPVARCRRRQRGRRVAIATPCEYGALSAAARSVLDAAGARSVIRTRARAIPSVG